MGKIRQLIKAVLGLLVTVVAIKTAWFLLSGDPTIPFPGSAFVVVLGILAGIWMAFEEVK